MESIQGINPMESIQSFQSVLYDKHEALTGVSDQYYQLQIWDHKMNGKVRRSYEECLRSAKFRRIENRFHKAPAECFL